MILNINLNLKNTNQNNVNASAPAALYSAEINKYPSPEGNPFPFMPTTNRLHSTFGCRRYWCYRNQVITSNLRQLSFMRLNAEIFR